MLCFCLNPNWEFVNKSWALRKLVVLVKINLSRILDREESKEMGR